ncbi:MAG: pilus assembly protein [Micrococcales bacterium]|nr:pilus assembly protein [Micrococcales bacterium]
MIAPERREDGRAIIEFIALGVILLIPLTYLVLTMARLQAGAFSASLAGREAARVFVSASTDAGAHQRAQAAARLAFEDFAFDGAATVTAACDGSPCLRPDGRITTTASVSVPLPLIPDIVAAHLPTSITLTSTHLQVVDRFVAR